jgi:NAD(P)H dehydrogenase (quinone)
MSKEVSPVLVTGAAGRVGGIGRRVVELLREAGVPVRATVRQEDERAAYLRSLGAEVVVVDLQKSEEVYPVVQGCRRIFFNLSVSSQYLEATVVMAAIARAVPDLEILVNMSQMTVSEMDFTHVTESPQQRLQWLSEQTLNWSGVPVTHLRPTVFQENPLFWELAAMSIERDGTISNPFGRSRTSPIASNDVAEVTAKILLEPAKFVGRTLELTGPRSEDMYDIAKEYSAALGRPISYVEVPLDTWKDGWLEKAGLPEHVHHHILTMAKLHKAGRYDRFSDEIEKVLGRPAASIADNIKNGPHHFPLNSKTS